MARPPFQNAMPPGPPLMAPPPPQLPPGWTEHFGKDCTSSSKDSEIAAPDGVTRYYYNAATQQSTYVRPMIPTAPASFPPFPPNGVSHSMQPSYVQAGPSSAPPPAKKPKKEKPRNRVPIPDTTWTRVTTNEGNVFYFEKESKRSEWTVPEEIKEAVAALEAEETARKEAELVVKREEAEREAQEVLKEQERVREEIRQEQRRKVQAKAEMERKRKDREEDEQPADPPTTNGHAEGETDKADGEGEDGAMGPVDAEDEEAWMKAVAAEFAESDAAAQKEQEDAKERTQHNAEEAAKQVFAVPDKVKVTIEEGRALFKVNQRLRVRTDRRPSCTKRIFRHSLRGTNHFRSSSTILDTCF